MTSERKYEILGVFVLALTVLLFLALVTDGYHGNLRRPVSLEASNTLGAPGAHVAGALTMFFGPAAHIIYCIGFVWGVMLMRHMPLDRFWTRLAGLLLLVAGLSMMVQLNGYSVVRLAAERFPDQIARPDVDVPMGGVLGAALADPLIRHIGAVGANVVAGAVILIGLLLSTELLFFQSVASLAALIGTSLMLLGAAVYSLARGIGRGASSVFGGAAAAATQARAGVSRLRETAVKKKLEEESVPLGTSAIFEPDEEDADAQEAAAAPPERSTHPAAPVLEQDEAAEETESAEEAAEAVSRIRINLPTMDDAAEADVRNEEDAFPFDEVEEPKSAGSDGADDSSPFEEDDWAPAVRVEEETGGDDCCSSEEPSAVNDGEPADSVEADAVQRALEEAEERAFSEFQKEIGADEASPAGPRRKPMPRRKNWPRDELPEDYVYPKRYTKPRLDLFHAAEKTRNGDESEQLLRTSKLLEETLKTFGIAARVTEVTRGPTITRYELEPAPGIKVSRFTALADDLALALKAHRIRVEAPIPGKGRVGVEAPNKNRESVVVRELLESSAYERHKGALRLALGKDIAGDVQVADLASMPHLLVAGATGSGKTVCVKTMIASLLTTLTPDELQLMLIDPKMVELSIFDDIPHLMTPVVTDPKKAATSLRWLIKEMEERYRLFTHLRVRNIEVYNESVENGEIEMPPAEGSEELGEEPEAVDVIRKLPYIVCIIDELADLMMMARAEVEDAIARLAQLARAVGIHLILATQRPSVDVLTGVIKANFPARISFQVSSKVDSRCILDQMGAERLIGMGDMLYLPAGQKPQRIQGAFVSDEEMNDLIAYLKTQAPPQYREEIERFGGDKESVEALEDEDDDLFEDAVRIVLETGQASISMVQRRLRVGYTRAARLIDMMEMKGIVGPHVGSKAREILVDLPSNGEVS